MRARRWATAIPAAVVVLSVVNPLRAARADGATVKACTASAEDGQRLRAAGKLIDARFYFFDLSIGDGSVASGAPSPSVSRTGAGSPAMTGAPVPANALSKKPTIVAWSSR